MIPKLIQFPRTISQESPMSLEKIYFEIGPTKGAKSSHE